MFKIRCKQIFLVTLIFFTTPLSANTAIENSKLGAQALLKTNTWQYHTRYNVSHFLMLPMFYAYEKEDKAFQKDFDSYVKNFFENNEDQLDFKTHSQRLKDIQFLYFLTTYAVLSGNKNPQYTKQMLQDVEDLWLNIPAWQWERKPFDNIKQRLDWKIQADQKVGYKRAIIDEEFFTLGAAANLSRIYPDNSTLKEINSYTVHIYKQRSSLDNGRWLFDIGAWDNHPTFAYSGYSNTENITVKKPKKDIVTDTSHFMRMPVLLWSFQGAFPQKSEESLRFQSYRSGLEKQFFDKVIVRQNSKILVNNFMDGSNGVFRWEYPSLGKGKGYEPYDLTPSLGMGWWALLPGTRVQTLYKEYHQQIKTSNKEANCKSMMKNKIVGNESKYDFKLTDCMYLFNTELASKINNKSM